jgi:hypothetical protein
MANTMATVTSTATRFAELSKRMRQLHWDMKEALSQNSTASIDWAAGQKPAVINEDAAGNIDGQNFSRTDLANAIGTVDAIGTLMGQGHLGNLEKLSQLEN